MYTKRDILIHKIDILLLASISANNTGFKEVFRQHAKKLMNKLPRATMALPSNPEIDCKGAIIEHIHTQGPWILADD